MGTKGYVYVRISFDGEYTQDQLDKGGIYPDNTDDDPMIEQFDCTETEDYDSDGIIYSGILYCASSWYDRYVDKLKKYIRNIQAKGVIKIGLAYVDFYWLEGKGGHENHNLMED